MTTTIHLVRHAAHELVDRVLIGRNTSIGLSGAGFQQAQALGNRFASSKLASVQSSPQLRARQTARPIAEMHGLPLEDAPEFDEIDVGTWTGRSFEELKHDSQWQVWNSQRDTARPPRGESMRELQCRVVDCLYHVAKTNGGEEVVIVSHAEPIRAAVLHYLQLSLDNFLGVQIAPASVTTLVMRGRNGEIVVNSDSIKDCVAA